ncbi:villin-1-like isoform X2 [Frankliniella occidentalis]|uniref:Villin-1-like isoform X2 n=1 Tax=Frankliniella occidentalis TaxID=133901 RepID=A0A6J1SQN3_FRAOC|nr:villin-1-like isoform X2 [Frankliniella occidentalis]
MRILRNRRQAGEWVYSTTSSTSCSSSGHSCDSPTEPAFRHVGRHSTGFHVWRVEHLQVVTVPRDQWGTFHDGDSYLLFASSERDQPAGPHTRAREVRGAPLEQHVHVWVGGAAGPDESGAAAYKASELDEALGGRCVLHRELQGFESTRFLAYFKHVGIRVLKGSVSSVGAAEPSASLAALAGGSRLFRVSGRPGRRCPVVTELPSVAWRHFSSGGVFIVSTPHALMLWMGRYAAAAERLQAAQVAAAMRDEGQPRALVLVDEGREVLLPADKFSLMTEALDPRRAALEVHHSPPPSHGAHGLDALDLERAKDRPRVTLYHCADKDDTCMVTEVKSGPLDHSDLSHSDSYIVDRGSVGVWVWLGRLVGERDRVEAMRNAQGFVRKKGYAAHTPITRVTDGCEPAEFRCLFRTWHAAAPVAKSSKTKAKSATTVHTRLDALALRDSPRLAADLRLLDDGSGDARLWRVSRAGLVGVAARRAGRLHSGECYVLHYRYGHPPQHAIFYWLGRTSSGERQATAALWASEKGREVADESGCEAIIVRVLEDREPPSLRAIFKGRLAVLSGEAPPGDDSSSGLPASFLLRVDGSQTYDTRSVQVPRRPSSLRSSSVFVLRSKRAGWFLWCGRSSTGDEREMAKRVATSAGGADLIVVYEGQEKDDFWVALGGPSLAVEEYAVEAKEIEEDSAGHQDTRPARLYACLGASSSAFAVEELPNVSQEELCPDEILILDARDTIFVWIGRNASREARQKATNLAIEYLKTDPASRELDTTIVLLRQGHEPPMFTGFFNSWDPHMWNDYQSFDEVRANLEGRPIPNLSQQSQADLPCIREFEDQDKFPLQLLLDPDISHLPHTVDVFRKELHLTHSDFMSVFGMDYPTFAQLPLWRQHSLKKTAGLF